MAQLNPYFEQLKREYIFPVIEEKLAALRQEFPHAQIVNLGIGDIALPLAPAVAGAIARAAGEMATETGMRGYGPGTGYAFLREAIAAHEFSHLGITPDEIFISDGANSDTVNILDLFSVSNVIGIADPTYPAYLDASILQGQKKIIKLPCLLENNFAPQPPEERCDLFFLCTPNNPTGVAMTQRNLEAWVDYALRHDALLLIDNAYEAFIGSPDVPRSIFEIEGAKKCAIEFRSFSKSAGFTGLRCAYTILPKTVTARLEGKHVALHPLWNRRQATKFNGVAYPIQRGAEAVYSKEGKEQTRAQVALYKKQAMRLKEGLTQLGLTCYGGIDAPYIWVKTPGKQTAWEFFDTLLKRCQLICIPGSGFGSHGEGFVRFSAFTTEDATSLALERLSLLGNLCDLP